MNEFDNLFFLEDMPRCTKYVKNVWAKDHEGLECPVDEIINEAYIKLNKSGDSYMFENFKSLLFNEVKIYTVKESRLEFKDMGNVKFRSYLQLEDRECVDCKEILPLSEYHVHRKYPSGKVNYHSFCKKCSNKRQARTLAIRRQNPTYNELYLKKMRDRQAKREEVIKNNPKLNAHFKALKRENSRKWAMVNPDKVTAIWQAQKIRLKEKRKAA